MPADAPSPQPLTEEQREWVRRNAGVVQQVARRVGHKLRDVHESDLVSAGEEGLVQAAREYDPEGGRSFRSWAWIRVQGAMLNAVRELYPERKRLENARRSMTRAQAVLEDVHAKAPHVRRSDLQARLALHRQAVERATAMVLANRLAADDVADDSMRPDQALEHAQTKARLRAAIARLPDNDRELLQRVYFDGVSMRDYAKEIGVQASTVSRRHLSALGRLAGLMKG